MLTAQEEFDRTYITSSEVCKTLKIARSTLLHGRRRGLLPDPVVINGNQLMLWKRDNVQEHLARWATALRALRGTLST